MLKLSSVRKDKSHHPCAPSFCMDVKLTSDKSQRTKVNARNKLCSRRVETNHTSCSRASERAREREKMTTNVTKYHAASRARAGGDVDDEPHTVADVSWDACARRADARVRACLTTILSDSSTMTVERTDEGTSFKNHVHTPYTYDAAALVVGDGTSASDKNEGVQSQSDDMNRHSDEEEEEACDGSPGEMATNLERDMIIHLENVLSCEREARKDLERELATRDDAVEALEAKARATEAAREEAIAEARRLQGEVSRVETVTRQEENVTRLRLEAEHEVRVGRLATELDRVRGELEARNTALEEERQKAAAASDELKRVRDELIMRLNKESHAFLETISSVNEAIGACGENLRLAQAPVPRMSQSVPSHRDRASIDIAAPTPVSPSPTIKSAGRSEQISSPSRVSHRAIAPHAPPQRRLQMQAQPDRRMKPVASQKGVVGYANIYAEERLARRAIA